MTEHVQDDAAGSADASALARSIRADASAMARIGRVDASAMAQIDRAIRQSFILLDALDRRTLSAIAPPLTTAQYHALAALSQAPVQSLGDLAARLLCDKANASGLLDRLTALGLATRTRDRADKRRVALSLTPAGRDALERATWARSAALTSALLSLDVAEVTATRHALDRLVALLQTAVAENRDEDSR